MSKDEKIYLLAVIYCVSAFAHTSGWFAAFWGFMFVLAGYNFVSAQHRVHPTAAGGSTSDSNSESGGG